MSDFATETRGAKALVQGVRWVDLSKAEALRKALQSALTDPAIHSVGLNLGATDYIDSATVSILIQAKAEAEDVGKSFSLVHPNSQVLRVLEETRLIDLFHVLLAEGDFWSEEKAAS